MIFSLVLAFVFLDGEFPISTAPNKQWDQAVAFGKDKYLVVWEDTRKTGNNINNDIWGQFVSKDGVLIDTNFPICLLDSGQQDIDVAFGDSTYLVVWRDLRIWLAQSMYGQLVSYESGLVGTPFSICATEDGSKEYCKIARGRDKYLVVWHENYHSDSCRIWGRLVSFNGEMAGDSFRIGTEKQWNMEPAVAFDGQNYLVVWCRTNWKSSCDIYGQMIDSTGNLIGTAFFVIEGRNIAMISKVASNGTNYLVVTDGVVDTIFGQMVGTDGSLVGPPLWISAEPGSNAQAARVGWDGTNYLVVWYDDRAGNGDPYGQWLSPAGELLDTNFAIIRHPVFQGPPRIASDGEGKFLTVWSDSRGDGFDLWGKIVSKTGVEESEKRKVKSVRLEVYPNPFIQSTVIGYQLPLDNKVSLNIYDSAGRLVNTLVQGDKKAGYYTVRWDGKDKSGKKVPSGISFCHLSAGKFEATRKFIILR